MRYIPSSINQITEEFQQASRELLRTSDDISSASLAYEGTLEHLPSTEMVNYLPTSPQIVDATNCLFTTAEAAAEEVCRSEAVISSNINDGHLETLASDLRQAALANLLMILRSGDLRDPDGDEMLTEVTRSLVASTSLKRYYDQNRVGRIPIGPVVLAPFPRAVGRELTTAFSGLTEAASHVVWGLDLGHRGWQVDLQLSNLFAAILDCYNSLEAVMRQLSDSGVQGQYEQIKRVLDVFAGKYFSAPTN